MNRHRLAELRSLAYHRRVASRLAEDPDLLDAAQGRCKQWAAQGHPHAQRWLRMIEGPRDELIEFMQRDDEEARELRQSTPFAGALAPKERWELWRKTKDEFEDALAKGQTL